MSAHQLASALSCHAWNADRSMLAVCPNSSEVWIFTGCHNPDSTTWKKAHTLTEHDLHISGIDWSPITNKIVTCSHDRNAFVWTLSDDGTQWDPALVILRINRAALAVKWSYDGNKFAVTSGAKCMPVCNYETDNSWWISKMIKKPANTLPGFAKSAMFKSSVVALDWHPNNELLATGCCDFFCRVFSAYNEGLDEGPDTGALGMPRQPFGNIVYQAQTSGWVECVAWAPSGNVLAYGAHDCSVGITDFSSGTPVEQSVSMTSLPLLAAVFLADDTLVGAGYDFNPALITQSGAGGTWEFNQFLDKKKAAATSVKRESGFSSARSMFESKVSRGGEASGGSAKDKLWTKHENACTDMVNMGNGFVSTTGTDGKIVIWNMAECCS